MREESLVIHKIFSDTVSKFPDKIALQLKQAHQWKRFTYKDLQISSQKVATFLIKEGFKKGDSASIILENRPEWAIIYLGIMYAGLTGVPLDPQLTPSELKNLIIDSTAKLVFCSQSIFTEKIKPHRQDYPTKFVILDNSDYPDQNIINFSHLDGIAPDKSLMPDVLTQDIASLIYTSGTTSKPKGVLLSHKNICSNFRSIEKLNICFPSDNILSLLPLHHTYAFMVTLMVPLFLGAKVTYFASFKPQDINQVIKEAGITILVGVPQLFSLFHKAIFDRLKNIPFVLRAFTLPLIKKQLRTQFKSLRLLISGGARLPAKTGRDLSALGFKLIEGYGLTETSPVVTINPPQRIKFGSVGKPIPSVQIQIHNPDKSGVGEVLIKGPNVMPGYFRRPELTHQVIKEEWFYSGDLGYLDKEGYLYLVGREKELIVLGSGKNIYPEELEESYSQSPYIKELCILARPEERFGHLTESLYAIVVVNLEYFRKTNETNIRERIRWELENKAKDLPSYKHIMGFTITKEELPRTALKKLKRYEIKQRYLKEKLLKVDIEETEFCAEDRRLLEQSFVKRIMEYISGEVHKPVYLDSHLEIDLGIDSLSRVELGMGLEALLSIKIPDEVIYSVSTVKEVIIDILNIVNQTASVEYKIERSEEKNWHQLLRESPKEVMLKKVRIESNFLDRLLTWIFKMSFLFTFRIFWLLRIEKRGPLPNQGPYILCPNHASYLDGFAVFSSLPFKNACNIFFIGYRKIFEHPLIGWTSKIARLIPIDPETNLVEAMQAISYVISYKKLICIFPEGRRSINENVQPFKRGVGILLKELDIPIIPVYIKGSHYSWPRGAHLPRLHPLKLIFGKALYLKELMKEDESVSYETIAERLREEVLKLACQDI